MQKVYFFSAGACSGGLLGEKLKFCKFAFFPEAKDINKIFFLEKAWNKGYFICLVIALKPKNLIFF